VSGFGSSRAAFSPLTGEAVVTSSYSTAANPAGTLYASVNTPPPLMTPSGPLPWPAHAP
jgi:hypothetical protein